MRNDLADAVAAAVRAEFGVKQTTAAAVARQMGKSHAYMSRRVTGDVPFDITDLAQIAVILNLPSTHFLTAGARRYAEMHSSAEPPAFRQPVASAA